MDFDAAEVVAAIDVGGTFMKGALFGLDGRRVRQSRRATDAAAGPAAVVHGIVRFVQELLAAAGREDLSVRGVGLAVPGWVDENAGVARGSTNIGWSEVPLRRIVTDAVALPVVLRHDVRAGAIAELRRGAARGERNFVFVPIGTGIGAAIVLNEMPWTGDDFTAGELGHIPVAGMTNRCGCGRVGCVETIASAAAIACRYGALSGRDVGGARDVAQAVDAGDAVAINVWGAAIDAIARAILISSTILGIECYVLGGGLALAGRTLFDPLGRALAELPHEGARPRVAAAQLGDDAGCIGAALAITDVVTNAGSTKEV